MKIFRYELALFIQNYSICISLEGYQDFFLMHTTSLYNRDKMCDKPKTTNVSIEN